MSTATRRISVVEVKRAYKKLGVKPVEGAFFKFNSKNKVNGCCGMGAILLTKVRGFDPAKDEEIATAETLFTPRYIAGFTRGFDGKDVNDPMVWHNPDHNTWWRSRIVREGWRDGLAAREAVGLGGSQN